MWSGRNQTDRLDPTLTLVARQPIREHLQTTTLDIFLTHAHLDHVVGLTFLFDVLYGRQMERVHVHGELNKLQAIAKHLFSRDGNC